MTMYSKVAIIYRCGHNIPQDSTTAVTGKPGVIWTTVKIILIKEIQINLYKTSPTYSN